MTRGPGRREPGGAAWLNLGVKATLLGLIVLYLAQPELPQFEGKAMLFRSAVYPLLAVLVPAIWLLRGRPTPYPHLADALLVLPMVIDSAGNALDAYDYEWFGPVIHGVNIAILVVCFSLLLFVVFADQPLARTVTIGLAVGLASVLHVVWELLEWGGNVLLDTNLDITYATTMRNLGLGLVGMALGALVAAPLLVRRPELGSPLFRRAALRPG
ncbi:MAG TPA: hypothetical protein VFL61_09065 [Gaiellaceae bacterium]|nr:hypothetical protein [Gaiellaceae bacterium]